MSNLLTKMMSSVLQSSAKSLLTGGIKKGVKTLIKQQLQKSPQDIEKEIVGQLGYLTSHYKLDKDQNIVFKPSSVFMHEWLTNSPKMTGRLVKDEENGQVYVDEALMTNQVKVELIHLFIRDTNVQSAALAGHFDAALKLLNATDYNALKFLQAMKGWNPSNTSVIDSFLKDCFGSALETDKEYACLIFRHWIIGAARRATHAGSVLDGCLVLQGPSGVGKTSFFRNLMPVPFEHRTGEIYCGVKSANKIVESLLGKSVAAFDELSILEHPNTLETFKSLLTMNQIDTRLAWAKEVRRFKMRCALAATVNPEKFLTDPALSRRMWVIQLNNSKRLDFEYLAASKKALWMEAVYYAEQGESCIMNEDEQKLIETYNAKFAITH